MEEESNVFKDLLGGVRSLLKERLVSPLLPSFTLSWIFWNYRTVVAVFSDEDLEKKFAAIDSQYPTLLIHFRDGALIPLVFALAYIYLYPIVSVRVYKHSLERQLKLRKARQDVENKKVLDEEEKQRLLAFTYDQKAESQKELDKQQMIIEQLRAKIAELENITRANPPLISEQQGLPDPGKILYPTELTEDKFKVLGALSYAEDNEIETTEEKDLRNLIKAPVTELRIIIEDLERSRLIQKRFIGNKTCYVLTHEGRVAFIKKKEERLGKK